MKPEEFAKRLSALPEVEPDEIDLAMLENAAESNDETAVSLEAFNQSMEDNTERVELYLSRSLLKLVQEAANREGISLNQYVLHKLVT